MIQLTPSNIEAVAKLFGLNIDNALSKFEATKREFGAALDEKQQIFVSKNWKDVEKFLYSKEGKEVSRLFVEEWEKFLAPKLEK